MQASDLLLIQVGLEAQRFCNGFTGVVGPIGKTMHQSEHHMAPGIMRRGGGALSASAAIPATQQS